MSISNGLDTISRREFEEHMDNLATKLDHVQGSMGKLDYLERIHDTLVTQNTYVVDMKDALLHAAIGRDHISSKIAARLFGFAGIIITGLVFVIVFLLTGEHWGWIAPLKH